MPAHGKREPGSWVHLSVRVLVICGANRGSVLRSLIGTGALSWSVEVASDGSNGVCRTDYSLYDLIIFDRDGCCHSSEIEIAPYVRRCGSRAVFVVITGEREQSDLRGALEGIRLGVDDYVFSASTSEDIQRRLAIAVARGPTQRIFQCGSIRLDTITLQATIENTPIDLTKHQWLLLLRMMSPAGETVCYDELCSLSGIQRGRTFKNLHNEIDRLRSRIGAAVDVAIQTVPRVGYRMCTLGLPIEEWLEGPRITRESASAALRVKQ